MAKVNVYIPDDLLEHVDADATALGRSRSSTVQEALAEYVATRAESERRAGAERAIAIADRIAARLVTVPPVAHVLEAALDQAAALGCDFYNACAPALAALMDADLYSGDRRAHASFPGVHLID